MAALLPVFHILSTEEWNCTQPTLFRLLSSTLDLGPCVKEASFWVQVKGGVAQMVERSLSMREVRGSIPLSSTLFFSQSNPSFLVEKCFGLHIGFPFIDGDSGHDLFSFSFLSR